MRHRADPLLRRRFERLREIHGDVLDHGLAAQAHRVEGQLLAVDVLLAARLRQVAEGRQRLLELGGARDLVRVGAARAADRLEDERVADLLRGFADFVCSMHASRPRHPQAGSAQARLHQLLVAKRHHGIDRHAGHAPALAQARGEENARLPVGQHAIDGATAQPVGDAIRDVVLVEHARHGEVVGEIRLHVPGKRVTGRVPDAVDGDADLGEPAHELGHLRGIAGGKEDGPHRGCVLA